MGSRTVSVMVLSSKVVVLAGCLCLLVDALPAPQPVPAPEPFFGLGLLGRLLAAYSSGDKDNDKGNCQCNRRTFHTKEKKKEKDKKCNCDCLTSGYGAPVSDYGAPSSVCACDRTFGNHKEKDKD